MDKNWKEVYPFFKSTALQLEIEKVAVFKKFKKGDVVFNQGRQVISLPLILSGILKVSRWNEQGKEIALYSIQAGESCAQSIQCCNKIGKINMKVIAVEDTEIYMIPIQYIDLWRTKYREWDEFILQTFKNKFNQLLETIDLLAFSSLEDRLVQYLKNKQQDLNNNTLKITHQDIAYDLNSSREVISRILKALEHSNSIILGRSRIEIVNL